MENFKKHSDYNLSVGDCGTVVGPKGSPLKPRISNCGYHRVVTYVQGKHKSVSVHRLVAETFLSGSGVVNHIDGNKANNCVSNLEWCTASENAKHAIKTGLRDPKNAGATQKSRGTQRGVNNGRAKVNEQIVREIRATPSAARGDRPWEKYGISNVMYRNIQCGKNWGHVL